MSVINQMLQELEQRRVDGGAAAAQVRAVQRPDRSGAIRWVLLTMFVAAVVGSVYWFADGHEGKNFRPAMHSVVAPTSTLSPAAGTRPVQAQAQPQPQPETLPQVLQLAGELGQLPVSSKKNTVAEPPATEVVPAVPAVESLPKPAVPIQKAPVAETAALSSGAINKEIRQLNPQQRAENAYRQAYASLQQGRMGEAEESLRQALQHDPRHAAARQALAVLLVEMKQLDRAEHLLQQGLEFQPGQAGFAMTLARLQVEHGDVAAALATLQRHPPAGEGAEYHGFMAALLQRSERHKEAIEHYQSALRSNPASGPWLLGLGISLQADGQNARAADAFRRARASGSLSAELQAFAEQRLKQVQ